MKLCMYVRYHTANDVSNFGGDPVTQFNLINLKNVFLYEIGLIAIREVSPTFDEEQKYWFNEVAPSSECDYN